LWLGVVLIVVQASHSVNRWPCAAVAGERMQKLREAWWFLKSNERWAGREL
jgi:hypothetical protein